MNLLLWEMGRSREMVVRGGFVRKYGELKRRRRRRRRNETNK